MSQVNSSGKLFVTESSESKRMHFKVFHCYSKKTHRPAILHSFFLILQRPGFNWTFFTVDQISHQRVKKVNITWAFDGASCLNVQSITSKFQKGILKTPDLISDCASEDLQTEEEDQRVQVWRIHSLSHGALNLASSIWVMMRYFEGIDGDLPVCGGVLEGQGCVVWVTASACLRAEHNSA